MNKFDKIIKQIKQYNDKALCIVVEDKQFDQPFLLVSTSGMKQKIMLFDGEHGLDEFAEISYSRPTKGIVLSSFKVNENMQQQGYGRFLFELATTHADVMGGTHLAGTANPIAPIKDVSALDRSNFEQEQQTLITIYKKLGCEFVENDNFFKQTWNNGDKIKKASPVILELAYKIAETYGFSPPSQMS